MRTPLNGVPVIGVAGWKNSGKTTLVERLIGELSGRGLQVASIKHAHHAFQVDEGATDSARHRKAGAQAVAIVSSARVAVVRELNGAPEPALHDVLSLLGPADIVLVEGYKAAQIPKIEVRRRGQAVGPLLAAHDPMIVALASDHGLAELGDIGGRPLFALDDVESIADFILELLKIAPVTSTS